MTYLTEDSSLADRKIAAIMWASMQQQEFKSEREDSVRRGVNAGIRARCGAKPECERCAHGYMEMCSNVLLDGFLIKERRICSIGKGKSWNFFNPTCRYFSEANKEIVVKNTIVNIPEGIGIVYVVWQESYNCFPSLWGIYDNIEMLSAFLLTLESLKYYRVEAHQINPTGMKLANKTLYYVIIAEDGSIAHIEQKSDIWFGHKPEIFQERTTNTLRLSGLVFGENENDAIQIMDMYRKSLQSSGKWKVGTIEDFNWRDYV